MTKPTKNQIPDGWTYAKLGDVVIFWNGKGHEKEIVKDGEYIVVNSKFISSDAQVRKFTSSQRSPLRKDDIAMVMSDVPNGKAIAKTFLIDRDDLYTLNQRIGGFHSKSIESHFLTRILNRNKYFLRFDDGVSQTNLRRDDILFCPLLFPPLPEQHRIVAVLETWDKYLEELDRKIEVKKNIKKGLMQRLLSGKVRLPGFDGEWKGVRLGDVCNIRRGGSPRPIKSFITNNKNGYNWLRIGDIDKKGKYVNETQDKITESGLSKTTLVHAGDFILSNSMSFGRPYIMKITACIHDGWLTFQEIDNQLVDKDFLYYLLLHPKTQNEFVNISAGSGVRNLKKESVARMFLSMPSQLEQSAIADVLSTADREIGVLEEKRKIIAEQKKFLLNNLITGKIRVLSSHHPASYGATPPQAGGEKLVNY